MSLWLDLEPNHRGWVRTICKKCGRWIGNRFYSPKEKEKEREEYF